MHAALPQRAPPRRRSARAPSPPHAAHLAPLLLGALQPPLALLCRRLIRLVVCGVHPLVVLFAVKHPAGVHVPGAAARARRRRARRRRHPRRHPLVVRGGQVEPVHPGAGALDLRQVEVGGEGGRWGAGGCAVLSRSMAGGTWRPAQQPVACSCYACLLASPAHLERARVVLAVIRVSACPKGVHHVRHGAAALALRHLALEAAHRLLRAGAGHEKEGRAGGGRLRSRRQQRQRAAAARRQRGRSMGQQGKRRPPPTEPLPPASLLTASAPGTCSLGTAAPQEGCTYTTGVRT